MVDFVSRKGTAEDFFFRMVSTYSHFGYRTATSNWGLRWARHSSAAQLLWWYQLDTSWGSMTHRAFVNLLHQPMPPPFRGAWNAQAQALSASHFPFSILNFQFSIALKGIYSDGDPPLPIPNREVKPVSADGTALGWESRSMPNLEERASSKTRSFLFCLVFNSSFSIFNCFITFVYYSLFLWEFGPI